MDQEQNTTPEPSVSPTNDASAAQPPQIETVTSQAQPEPAAPIQDPAATPERNRGLEMVIPINRSGWSIAAGYVALFNIPFIFMAPIAIVLGILGLKDIQKNPNRAGRGRCWFAIIYGGVTVLLFGVVLYFGIRR